MITEVTSESWLSRLTNSIKSVLFGIILFAGSFFLIWWNEGRAVNTAKSLEEGVSIVQTIESNEPDPNFEGKLVHTTGDATTEETLTDNTFDISINALALARKVEMYQWAEKEESEKEKKVGGSTETVTTYSYYKEWSSYRNDSDNFKETEGYENPSMTYSSTSWTANDIMLGEFKLPNSLVFQMKNFTDLAVSTIDTTKVSMARVINLGSPNSMIYVGKRNGLFT